MRVLLVDDHPMSRLGMQMFLQAHHPDLSVTAVASVSDDTVIDFTSYQLVLLDYGSLPDAALTSRFDDIPVLVIRGDPSEQATLRVLSSGASAYALRSIPATMLSEIISGLIASAKARIEQSEPKAGINLTRREREIVVLVIAGQSNAQIAQALHVGVGTVKVHLNNVMRKFGVHNRTQLVVEISKKMPQLMER